LKNNKQSQEGITNIRYYLFGSGIFMLAKLAKSQHEGGGGREGGIRR
jgi:hypothetical protein